MQGPDLHFRSPGGTWRLVRPARPPCRGFPTMRVPVWAMIERWAGALAAAGWPHPPSGPASCRRWLLQSTQPVPVLGHQLLKHPLLELHHVITSGSVVGPVPRARPPLFGSPIRRAPGEGRDRLDEGVHGQVGPRPRISAAPREVAGHRCTRPVQRLELSDGDVIWPTLLVGFLPW